VWRGSDGAGACVAGGWLIGSGGSGPGRLPGPGEQEEEEQRLSGILRRGIGFCRGDGDTTLTVVWSDTGQDIVTLDLEPAKRPIRPNTPSASRTPPSKSE